MIFVSECGVKSHGWLIGAEHVQYEAGGSLVTSPRFRSLHQRPSNPLSTLVRVDDDVNGSDRLWAKHAVRSRRIRDSHLYHPDHRFVRLGYVAHERLSLDPLCKLFVVGDDCP